MEINLPDGSFDRAADSMARVSPSKSGFLRRPSAPSTPRRISTPGTPQSAPQTPQERRLQLADADESADPFFSMSWQTSGEPGDPYRALSVEYLHDKLEVELPVLEGETVRDIEPRLLTHGVNETCPRDGKKGTAYVDVANDPNAGFAGFMLSYSWQYRIELIISALVDFCLRKHRPRNETRVWICCFCVNQFRVQERLRSGTHVPFAEFAETFRGRVAKIGNILSLMDSFTKPLYLDRVWCLFEFHHAVTLPGCKVELILPDSAQTAFNDALANNVDVTGVPELLANIKVENADAFYPKDREQILNIVAPGVDLGNKEELANACAGHNKAVKERMQKMICEKAKTSLIDKHKKGTSVSVDSCSSVGWLLTTFSMYDDAKGIFEIGENIAKQSNDMDKPAYGLLQRNFGHCYRQQEKYEKASDKYEGALEVLRTNGQGTTADAAGVLVGLSTCRSKLGDHERAIEACNEALELYRACGAKAAPRWWNSILPRTCSRRFGAGNPDLAAGCSLWHANGMKSLGLIYMEQKEYEEAMKIFQASQDEFKKCGKTLIPWYGDLLSCMGRCHSEMQMHMYAQAKQVLENCGASSSVQYKNLLKNIRQARLARSNTPDAASQIVVQGRLTSDNDVLQIKTMEDTHVWLTYRHETRRWLVVYTTAKTVPLGCTGAYSSDIPSLLSLPKLTLTMPQWEPVLSEQEISAGVAEAKNRISEIIDSFLEGKATRSKELVVLFGPPGCGKTTFARKSPEIDYKGSVHLIQDEVIQEVTRKLFRKLCQERSLASHNAYEKEAFLCESLILYNHFVAVADDVIWQGKRNLLDEALRLGIGIITETTGAGLRALHGMFQKTSQEHYRVRAYFPRIPLETQTARIEKRFDEELANHVMLGGRRWDAYLRRLSSMAASNWPELELLCEEAHEVREDKKGSIELKRSTSCTQAAVPESACSVYVSGLRHFINDARLRECFGKIGRVKGVRFLSKSLAVIEYETSALAEMAVSELNGANLRDLQNSISVSWDCPLQKSGGKGGGKAGKTKNKC
eukprot:TRINITY_DN10555_c0_g3_i1.p1 TRINITY_DN10555_c0_g3~~TRINITY_DN10555_c0_g3_i1.p1  ORF type:complete len:1033 (+),score=160.65 TRINITY_DN10555_c0_g3_i1:68-3166(+)